MSMTDPIADLLTRIRNAQLAHCETAEIPFSKVKLQIVKILESEGYIVSHKILKTGTFPVVTVVIKYRSDRTGAIRSVKRVSTPGRRVYSGSQDIPQVLGGLGVTILSTSSGILTGKQAKKRGVGGEILCEVY